MNREAIYSALFNLATTSTGVVHSSRTLVPLDQVAAANFPALYQSQVEEPRSQNKGNPAIIRMTVDILLYAETSSAQVNDDTSFASTQLNNMVDALDVALAADPVTQTQTLGGLVSHCWITSVHYFEDTLTNRAACLIPIEILIDETSATQYSFDSGNLYLVDQANPNSTPQLVGGMQEINAQVKFETNMERGNFQYTVKAMRKASSITCKAKFANIKGAVLAQLLYGNTLSTGSELVAPAEVHTVPATGPYTVSVTHSAWYLDMGVVYDGGAAGGAQVGTALTFTIGVPAAGQYSVVNGVYTFNAADKGKSIAISYVYLSSTGNKLALSNPYSVMVPTFLVILNTDGGSKQVTWRLNACYSDQLSFITRLEDFALPEFSFTAQADASNNIGTFSYSS